MSFLPDCDGAIGRVRFAGVGRPEYRKRVRCEDRQKHHRYRQKIVRFHGRNVPVCSIGFYDTSGGFSDAAEGWIASPSFEGSLQGNKTAVSDRCDNCGRG